MLINKYTGDDNMSDYKKINTSEDYELNYILKKFGKRQTEENRIALQEIEKNYINLKKSKPISDKESFYNYLNNRQKFQNLN